jgi:WD40 repeat protein
VAFSPDGRRLATGSKEGTLKVWDVATWQPIRGLPGHTSGITSLSFSPDGRRLASSSQGGVIEVWDRDAMSPQAPGPIVVPRPRSPSWQGAHEPLTLMGHTGSVNQVAFSPDGMQLASASADGTIKVWDARSEPEARTFVGLNMAFSPDGKWLASNQWNRPFKVWDTTTRQQIGPAFDGGESAVAFSPDGKLIAMDSGKTVELWDIATGHKLRTFNGHTDIVTSVAFSRDGRWLASASWDGKVKLWDVATAREIHTFRDHNERVWTVAFGPDGTRLASASDGGTVRLWDVRTGLTVHTFEIGTPPPPGSLSVPTALGSPPIP